MPMKPRRDGYLLIDHRSGAGVSEEFIHASGRPGIAVPEGKIFEAKTITCAHCGNVGLLDGSHTNYCRKCDNHVCDDPVCNMECRPFIKTIDTMQERAFREENGYVILTNRQI